MSDFADGWRLRDILLFLLLAIPMIVVGTIQDIWTASKDPR